MGDFEVNGVSCQPAFHKLKEHLCKFTPEWGEGITTVPAATIRRLAAEFAREARIGSTIVVEGVTLPYRPVAAIAFRGSQGHRNSLYNFLAVDLLNHLVGAADVVGSCLGFNPVCEGHPETGRPHHVPSPDADGIMKVGMWMGYHLPYPPDKPKMPDKTGLQDLFPMGMCSPFLESDDQEDFWQKLELPYRTEVLINWGANLLLAIANSETVARALAKYKFMVSFDLFLTETAALAHVVLPVCSSFEKDGTFTNTEGHVQAIRQAVEPVGESRPDWEVFVALSILLGVPLEYAESREILKEIRSLIPGYGSLGPAPLPTKVDRATVDSYLTHGFERDLAARYRPAPARPRAASMRTKRPRPYRWQGHRSAPARIPSRALAWHAARCSNRREADASATGGRVRMADRRRGSATPAPRRTMPARWAVAVRMPSSTLRSLQRGLP